MPAQPPRARITAPAPAPENTMKVLHVAAEVFPWVKTGGLADVVAALPVAQAQLGADARLLLPGYPAVLDAVQGKRLVLDIGPCFGALRVGLVRGRLPGSQLPVYVVDAPYLYRRGGGPYQDAQGHEWADNLQRFGLLGWLAAHLAAGDADAAWVPDAVHAHDWHAGLSCAYMAEHAPTQAPAIFTVHNLAFQGLFPLQDGPVLGLPSRLMSPAGLEYHGQLSFMKAGLMFADRITTVSPSYAQEMATPEFGCGLDGVIRSRHAVVSGILNGIDDVVWNPATDAAIAMPYDAAHPAGKAACRAALQRELGFAEEGGGEGEGASLLLTVVSRLTAQKGLDLLLAALPELLAHGVQVAVQGTGDPVLEAAWREAAHAHPGRVHVHLGYDEARAHRLLAGADAIAVPSRFEPCGLTQLYGLRYGTLPIVRHVGGLADTVSDLGTGEEGTGTGFVFHEMTPAALAQAVLRARALRAQGPLWQAAMQRAMAQALGWRGPAQQYLQLYTAAAAAKGDKAHALLG